MDKATFQDWLGADVVLESGYRYALPERVKAILTAAFVAKDVDEDDVVVPCFTWCRADSGGSGLTRE